MFGNIAHVSRESNLGNLAMVVSTMQPDRASRKRRSSVTDTDGDSLNRPRKKPTACRPCHAKKVRCGGGCPCSNCQQSKNPDDCIYPVRDQKVTVSNSYIENLLAENRRLREQSLGESSHDLDGATFSATRVDETSPGRDDAARNPLLDERSWFAKLSSVEMPVHIGEAADTAFATRFRQALVEDPEQKHIPRVYYVSDSRLASLAEVDCPWPPLSRARLLVGFAMDTIGSCYHCVRKSELFKGLKQHYRTPVPTSNPSFSCKLWALFALGEAYSSRTQSISDDNFPGLVYFARASRVLRTLRERPSLDTIEVHLLMSLYSLLTNRRYNAYFLASTAVRLSVIMGMHLDMPEVYFPDRAAREHRSRVFWTSYILDRLWSSKMGHPVSIQDEDVEVDMPSDIGLSEVEPGDFFDAEYMNASIRLARISRDIIKSIYNRRATHMPFSQRVQKALSDLRGWVGGLPSHLQIETGETGRPLVRHVKWLHLSFNQYVIQATRPILLHVFQAHKQLWSTSSILEARELKKEIGETTLALAEACIRCARHSHRLLTASWIDGSFAIFDYNYTQYLFSSAAILAISSFTIGKRDHDDRDSFESASQFLEQLRQNGNFGAREFCRHFDAMKIAMDSFLMKNGLTDSGTLDNTTLSSNPFTSAVPPQSTFLHPAVTTAGNNFQPIMTAEMALAEPSLQDFLSQGDLDLGFLDTQMRDSRFQSLYIPVTLQDEEWTPRQN